MLRNLMKKALKILSIILGVVLLLLIIGLVGLNFYLGSDGFKTNLIAKVSSVLKAEVTIEKFDFKFWEGAILRGVKVKNPPGSKHPHLFEAEKFVFQYDFRELIRGRIKIDRLILEHPAVFLEQAKDGTWPLPGRSVSNPTVLGATQQGTAEIKNLVISKLKVNNGMLIMQGKDGETVVRFSGADLESTVDLANKARFVGGDLSFKELVILDFLDLADAKSPFVFDGQKLVFSNLTTTTYEGNVTGTAEFKIGDADPSLHLKLNGEGLNVSSLLKKYTDSSDQLQGKLYGPFTLDATASRPKDLTGLGNIEIRDGKFIGYSVMQKIGSYFNIAEFQDLPFQKMTADVTIANQSVLLNNIILHSKDVQMKGYGSIDFNANYDLRVIMTMSPRLMDQVPKDFRKAFEIDGTGLGRTPEFKVYGQARNLSTDLTTILGMEYATRKLEEITGDAGKDFMKMLGIRKDKNQPKPPVISPLQPDEAIPQATSPASPVVPPTSDPVTP